MDRRHRTLALAGAAALVAAVGSASDGNVLRGMAPASSRCVGAAARDPRLPCHEAALAKVVIPTPRRALALPNARCGFLRASIPFVCRFGAPADRATRTIALLGDSHATHWRSALGPVAEAK